MLSKVRIQEKHFTLNVVVITPQMSTTTILPKLMFSLSQKKGLFLCIERFYLNVFFLNCQLVCRQSCRFSDDIVTQVSMYFNHNHCFLFFFFSLVVLFSQTDSLRGSFLQLKSRLCSVQKEHHLEMSRHLHIVLQFPANNKQFLVTESIKIEKKLVYLLMGTQAEMGTLADSITECSELCRNASTSVSSIL